MRDASAETERGGFQNLCEFPLSKFSVRPDSAVITLVRVQYLTWSNVLLETALHGELCQEGVSLKESFGLIVHFCCHLLKGSYRLAFVVVHIRLGCRSSLE